MSMSTQHALPMPDAAIAEKWRQAADVARVDPHFTPKQRAARAAYYDEQARRFEPPNASVKRLPAE